MSTALSLDSYLSIIGQKLAPGEWVKVDQAMINVFADVTLGHQYIHIDPEAAKKTAFSTTVPLDCLNLCLLAHLMEGRMPYP